MCRKSVAPAGGVQRVPLARGGGAEVAQASFPGSCGTSAQAGGKNRRPKR